MIVGKRYPEVVGWVSRQSSQEVEVCRRCRIVLRMIVEKRWTTANRLMVGKRRRRVKRFLAGKGIRIVDRWIRLIVGKRCSIV